MNHTPFLSAMRIASKMARVATADGATAPDAAELRPVDALDIKAKLRSDWRVTNTPQIILQKGVSPAFTYRFALIGGTVRRLQLVTSVDGTAATSATSDVLADGLYPQNDDLWHICVTAVTPEAKFWYSADGVTWAQWGATKAYTLPNPLFQSESTLGIGVSGLKAEGWHWVEIRHAIDGPLVANPRFDKQSAGTRQFFDAQGNPWTVNGTAAIIAQ